MVTLLIKILLSCVLSELATDLVALIGLVLSYIGIRQTVIARKDIARIKIEERRIQEVNNLVRFLNSHLFLIRFEELNESGLDTGGSTSPFYYNLFEIGNLANYGDTGYNSKNDYNLQMIHRTNIQFDDALVVFATNSNSYFDVKRFIDNVYIPQEIANALMSFAVTYHDEKTLPLEHYENSKIVIINPYTETIGMTHCQKVEVVQCEACKSWLNLKNHANTVLMAINTWYKKHGVKDWNYRIDYKNGVDFLKLIGIK